MMSQPLFEERFLDQYTGRRLLHDPITALVELVANAWDAGATRVDIQWPSETSGELFVRDNGEGMTEDEFKKRWLTLSYNRLAEQGYLVGVVGFDDLPKRKTFGQNGIGRFAGFCFAKEYEVNTSKNGNKIYYLVLKSNQNSPIELKKLKEEKNTESGTEIKMNASVIASWTVEKIKSELGMRFLSDPSFRVFINGSEIGFSDLPKNQYMEFEVEIPGHKKTIRLILIDVKKTDKTTKQHGIAWQVNKRLVGECSWQGSGHDAMIDGRRIEAKRYTFIVFADVLFEKKAVKPDWSGFEESNEEYKLVFQHVQNKIKEILINLTAERREEIATNIRDANAEKLKVMSPISRQKWSAFVDDAQEKCPQISEKDLNALSSLLANLELANSRYKLIHQLHEMKPEQLDNLHGILNDWGIDSAKIVLDELQWRLDLIKELKSKTESTQTLEVQELQPLFAKGLWIFGPEFETIEYTSNEGMTKVISKLFNGKEDGSRLRPDFAILPDSSCGLYSYPEYDEEFSELGVSKLVVIELKKPGVILGSDEKQQAWKYVKELYAKTLVDEKTDVRCFVIGSKIDPQETGKRTEKNGKVVIQPMLFDHILKRAESRVLKLYEKVKSAPFLKGEIDDIDFNGTSRNGQEEILIN